MIWTSLIAQGKRRLLMSVLLAVLLSFVYFYLSRFYRDRVDGWILVIGWVVILLNLARAVLGALYRLDRHPFSRFDLGLEDDRARPGRAFRLWLVLQARRPVKVERLTAELRCLEEKLGVGEQGAKVLHRQERVVSEGLSVARGSGHRFEVELPVPAGAPFSYKDVQGRIRWSISILGEVADWEVVRDEFEVTVAPGSMG
jgi:hypothetical protein